MVFEFGDDERLEKKERRRRNAELADILDTGAMFVLNIWTESKDNVNIVSRCCRVRTDGGCGCGCGGMTSLYRGVMHGIYVSRMRA